MTYDFYLTNALKVLNLFLFIFQVLGLYGGGTWGSVKTLLGAGVGGLGPFPCRENEPFWKMPHKGKIWIMLHNILAIKKKKKKKKKYFMKHIGI